MDFEKTPLAVLVATEAQRNGMKLTPGQLRVAVAKFMAMSFQRTSLAPDCFCGLCEAGGNVVPALADEECRGVMACQQVKIPYEDLREMFPRAEEEKEDG